MHDSSIHYPSFKDYNYFVDIPNYKPCFIMVFTALTEEYFPFFLFATNDATIVRTIQSEALFLQIVIEVQNPSTFNW